MVRRLISAVAVVACAGSYALIAAERATFILTDGERKSGPVVFHTDSRENLIAGNLNLGAADGKTEMTFPADQVAVIDFVGGRPAVAELAQLGSGQMIAMRDGSTQPGQFINMTGGDTVVWQNQAGQTQVFPISSVSRIYLNPQSARTAFRYTGATTVAGVAGTTGTFGPGITVRVDAKQAWTDTGVTVNQGDRVVFNASGQIQFGQNATQTATPDGNPVERRASYPIHGAGRRPARKNRQRRAVRDRHADAAAGDAGLGPVDARDQRQRARRQQRILLGRRGQTIERPELGIQNLEFVHRIPNSSS